MNATGPFPHPGPCPPAPPRHDDPASWSSAELIARTSELRGILERFLDRCAVPGVVGRLTFAPTTPTISPETRPLLRWTRTERQLLSALRGLVAEFEREVELSADLPRTHPLTIAHLAIQEAERER